MTIFDRTIEKRINESLFKGRMIAILGPRQSGKTTLAKKIISTFGDDALYLDCQLAEVRSHFVVGRPEELLSLVSGKKIVVFDEAQTIQDIGSILKAFHDTYLGTQIIATGSSSFDLSNKINEPMTGRIFEFILLPLSLEEIRGQKEIGERELKDIILYGSYPAVAAAKTSDEKKLILKNIATQYLYKDIFIFESIRNPRIFEELVKLLALQTGTMVSLNELARHLGISRSVVQKYLRLLEQAFIIKIVHSFSTNPRTELKKSFKIFFLDSGIRNAIVDVESSLDERSDKGAIFENFVVSERIKNGNNNFIFPPEIMFWRMRAGFEIDIIEKNGEKINAIECKWSDDSVIFSQFHKLYPRATTSVATFQSFL